MNRFNRLINSRFYHSGGGRLYGKILFRLVSWYYHCDIPCECKFEKVFFCHRGFGTVISTGALIGKGTIIHHAVTIGASAIGEYPVIGEKCIIGAKAVIIGAIKIGNNVKVGAGAVVVNDVPDNCTVVGVPARIVRSNKKLEDENK